ncbi:hypothetical protein CYY_002276 [Polysphondylium violaceum]|uniref:Amino acid transporter transmembrane domain-containing protein n=1 Tax=Polysphondylium violaceum TaxID=133409 RepID=A0A8J4Q1V9_9MYCE|nr:hypothetical protein CYY_002276 [Polysphondylium violaceum]
MFNNSIGKGKSINQTIGVSMESPFAVEQPMNADEFNDEYLLKNMDLSKLPSADDKAANPFGLKTIGTVGGICLLIGNMTGPGMVNISYQYQVGGVTLSTLAYILMMILSSFSGLFIIEAMAMIPGNPRFQLRVEFTMLCRFFFGKWGYIASQLFINISLQVTNIASIIICAQVMDSILIFFFKTTCGVSFTRGWICVHEESPNNSPFLDEYMLFTLGFLIIIAIIVPLGFLNLDDNIVIQIGCVIAMLIIVTSWVVIFCLLGLKAENLPAFGKVSGMAQIMGNTMFNYAFVTTIPSWVNESKPTVNINRSLWISTIGSTVIFIIIGVFGALAFSNMSASSDILSLITTSPKSNVFFRFSVYLFPFIVLASTIPVFSIVVRYNLVQNNFCSKKVANFFAIILPWLVTIPCLTGNWLNIISNYSSLFFNSIANFIIPFALYIRAQKFKKNNIISPEQRRIVEEVSKETVDWEENETILFEDRKSFKGLKGVSKKNSVRISWICMISFTILVLFVIFTNFYFPEESS